VAPGVLQELKLGGDLKGDGYQNGGCLVVGAGGSPTMLTYRQRCGTLNNFFTVPVPVPTFEKLRFRFQFQFRLLTHYGFGSGYVSSL
jgi:hypothetical protein